MREVAHQPPDPTQDHAVLVVERRPLDVDRDVAFRQCGVFEILDRDGLPTLGVGGVNLVDHECAKRHLIHVSGTLLLELVFEDLATRVARQHIDELDLFGDLLHRETGSATVIRDRGEVERCGAVAQHDHRAGALAARRVGETDHRDVGDVGVLVQHVFHLLGRDVLTLADDHILEPAVHGEVPVLVHRAEIAGTEEAVGVERFGVACGIEVAATQQRSGDEDLTGLADRDFVAVGVDDLERAVGDHAPLGGRAPRRRVAHGSHGCVRRFGEPVHRHAADAAELGEQLGIECGRLRCRTGEGEAQVGEQRRGGIAPLRLEVEQRERRSSGGDGETVAAEERGRMLGVVALHGERSRAGHQLAHEHADTTDVGEREHDRIAVALGHLEPFDHRTLRRGRG